MNSNKTPRQNDLLASCTSKRDGTTSTFELDSSWTDWIQDCQQVLNQAHDMKRRYLVERNAQTEELKDVQSQLDYYRQHMLYYRQKWEESERSHSKLDATDTSAIQQLQEENEILFKKNLRLEERLQEYKNHFKTIKKWAKQLQDEVQQKSVFWKAFHAFSLKYESVFKQDKDTWKAYQDYKKTIDQDDLSDPSLYTTAETLLKSESPSTAKKRKSSSVFSLNDNEAPISLASTKTPAMESADKRPRSMGRPRLSSFASTSPPLRTSKMLSSTFVRSAVKKTQPSPYTRSDVKIQAASTVKAAKTPPSLTFKTSTSPNSVTPCKIVSPSQGMLVPDTVDCPNRTLQPIDPEKHPDRAMSSPILRIEHSQITPFKLENQSPVVKSENSHKEKSRNKLKKRHSNKVKSIEDFFLVSSVPLDDENDSTSLAEQEIPTCAPGLFVDEIKPETESSPEGRLALMDSEPNLPPTQVSDTTTDCVQSQESRKSETNVKSEPVDEGIEFNVAHTKSEQDRRTYLLARLESPQGPNFKYKEVIRKKSERKQLHGEDCVCCREYYQVNKDLPLLNELGAPSERQRKQVSSRHRTLFETVDTPMGFWDPDFPTTQQVQEQQQAAKNKRQS